MDERGRLQSQRCILLSGQFPIWDELQVGFRDQLASGYSLELRSAPALHIPTLSRRKAEARILEGIIDVDGLHQPPLVNAIAPLFEGLVHHFESNCCCSAGSLLSSLDSGL